MKRKCPDCHNDVVVKTLRYFFISKSHCEKCGATLTPTFNYPLEPFGISLGIILLLVVARKLSIIYLPEYGFLKIALKILIIFSFVVPFYLIYRFFGFEVDKQQCPK